MERYFYHCFPRRQGSSSKETFGKGLKILESILTDGLLLTPEILEFKEPLEDGTFSKPMFNAQKRCCFTELSTGELKKHQEVFGEFALEFEIPTLRHLGAIPTFYTPAGKTGDEGMEYVANALMCRVGEIQIILDRLKQLKNLVSQIGNKNEVLKVTNNDVTIGSIGCTVGGAEDLINILTHGSQPVEILGNALQGLSQYFYPTENWKYNDELTYYRQREWRIIGSMMHHGKEITKSLNQSTIEKLVEIDEDFFNKKLEFKTGDYKIHEQCLIFEEYDDKPLIQFVNRIHVPNVVKEKVKNLLSKSDLEIEVVEN